MSDSRSVGYCKQSTVCSSFLLLSCDIPDDSSRVKQMQDRFLGVFVYCAEDRIVHDHFVIQTPNTRSHNPVVAAGMNDLNLGPSISAVVFCTFLLLEKCQLQSFQLWELLLNQVLSTVYVLISELISLQNCNRVSLWRISLTHLPRLRARQSILFCLGKRGGWVQRSPY